MIKPQGEREVEDMRVSIRKIPHKEDEQVILECVEMTKEFENVREYALMRGSPVGFCRSIFDRLGQRKHKGGGLKPPSGTAAERRG